MTQSRPLARRDIAAFDAVEVEKWTEQTKDGADRPRGVIRVGNVSVRFEQRSGGTIRPAAVMNIRQENGALLHRGIPGAADMTG